MHHGAHHHRRHRAPRCWWLASLVLLLHSAAFASGGDTSPAMPLSRIAQYQVLLPTTAGLAASPEFSRVDYRLRDLPVNLIDYCTNTTCGPCQSLSASLDPCQAQDAYGADSSICQLPDFLGGIIPVSSLCGVNIAQDIPSPDGSGDAAAYLSVYRNTSGYLFIAVLMSCDWLMVTDQSQNWTMSGAVTYDANALQFVQQVDGSSQEATQRYSCYTAPIQLAGLSSNCQNINGAVSFSFYAQRFQAAGSECAETSDVFLIQTSVTLGLQAHEPPASPAPTTSPSSGAASPPPLPAVLPAVLAMFQMQLDLSGPAAAAWMGGLDGAGPSSDVRVLGHDVGALIALPLATPGGPGCGGAVAASMLELVTSMSTPLGTLGAAVRSWACVPGPAYQNISLTKLPGCVLPTGAASSPGLPLLALALRVPSSVASPAAVLQLLAAYAPAAACMSAAAQVDVRTDIQIRILGQIPGQPPEAEAALRAAARTATPTLLPVSGPAISLTTGGLSLGDTFQILAAAEGSASPSARGSPQPGYQSPGIVSGQSPPDGGSGGGSSSSSAVTVALIAVLAAVLAAVAGGALAWWWRRTQGKKLWGSPGKQVEGGSDKEQGREQERRLQVEAAASEAPAVLGAARGDATWNSNSLFAALEDAPALGAGSCQDSGRTGPTTTPPDVSMDANRPTGVAIHDPSGGVREAPGSVAAHVQSAGSAGGAYTPSRLRSAGVQAPRVHGPARGGGGPQRLRGGGSLLAVAVGDPAAAQRPSLDAAGSCGSPTLACPSMQWMLQSLSQPPQQQRGGGPGAAPGEDHGMADDVQQHPVSAPDDQSSSALAAKRVLSHTVYETLSSTHSSSAGRCMTSTLGSSSSSSGSSVHEQKGGSRCAPPGTHGAACQQLPATSPPQQPAAAAAGTMYSSISQLLMGSWAGSRRDAVSLSRISEPDQDQAQGQQPSRSPPPPQEPGTCSQACASLLAGSNSL